MITLSNIVFPAWVKYAAIAGLVVAVWGHGYVKGLDRYVHKAAIADTKIIVKQGKVTEKVVYKYIKESKKIEEQGKALQKEGQSYEIKFPNDNYVFNNYFTWLYDGSISDSVPPLSSGNAADPSGVGVSEAIPVFLNNNTAGRMWEQRAKACEAWAEEQEKLQNGN